VEVNGQPAQGPPNGFSVVSPLPRRADDRAARTPSEWLRRERFTRDHPEIPLSSCRVGAHLVFTAAEPDGVREYDDASAMMDDLEARYPGPCFTPPGKADQETGDEHQPPRARVRI
jgi:hypothetical protein